MAHDTGVPASPMPGWYPDPAGSPELRWLDGAQWLNRTQPAGTGSAPGAPAALWFLVFVISEPGHQNGGRRGHLGTRDKLQASITKGIQTEFGVHPVITCPEKLPSEPGATFRCLARSPAGSSSVVTVTIRDRRGIHTSYTWRATPFRQPPPRGRAVT